jgi:hypothetical protein
VLDVKSPLVYPQTAAMSVTGGSAGGAVTYTLVSGPCRIEGHLLRPEGGMGICKVTATMAGNDEFSDVTSPERSVLLQRADQAAVTVTAPSEATYGTNVTATASGGSTAEDFMFSAGGSTGCMVLGTTVVVTNAEGSCVLRAIRTGDVNYSDSAPSEPFTVKLNKANQSPLRLTVPPSLAGGATGTATTTGGSGTGAVTYSAGASTGCAVGATTGVITVHDPAGTCAISASKAGDVNFNGPVTDGPKTVILQKEE